jgi:hypothetical protein
VITLAAIVVCSAAATTALLYFALDALLDRL